MRREGVNQYGGGEDVPCSCRRTLPAGPNHPIRGSDVDVCFSVCLPSVPQLECRLSMMLTDVVIVE